MKKILSIVAFISTFVLLVQGCINGKKETHTGMFSFDVERIESQISKSEMDDNGYRFSNAEMLDNISPYATYYINEAKRLFMNQTECSNKAFDVFIEKINNKELLNLTDIYCSLMLLDNCEDLSEETKESISDYFDTLYNSEVGCYCIDAGGDNDIFSNVYSTYIVEKCTTRLDIEIRPIQKWLESLKDNLIKLNTANRRDSSTYVMAYDLLQRNNFCLPYEITMKIKEMFENDIKQINTIIVNNEVYLPIYIMDYLDFCLLNDIDSTRYHDAINQILCDANGLKDGIIMQYDVLGLYASMRILTLTKYNFTENCSFSNIFALYDKFMLEDELYILPGYTKSNLSDTYYVNQISKYLNIELQTNTYEYCLKNKIKILDGTPVEIYYFLDLLENNEMLSIVQNDKDDIINNLCTILEEIIEKGINLEDYSLLNSIFKSFEIMEFEYFLSEERSNQLFEGFQSAENLEINIYYLGDFIELISILGYEQNVVCDFCKILEDDLMVLLQSKKCNKLLLLGKSLSIFEKCNYKISKECLELTMRMVNDSRDKSGLYRSGNEEDEMVGYNNTYYALRIADYIEIMAE